VNGRESTTGRLVCNRKRLLVEGQVFEDKILARSEDDDDSTDQVPEEGDHGPRISSHSLKWGNLEVVQSFVPRLSEVWKF
jgi:hypothetical protein